jgi:hypothetical protein
MLDSVSRGSQTLDNESFILSMSVGEQFSMHTVFMEV